MKVVAGTKATKMINSSTSELREYSDSLLDKDIDFCINKIKGRYPESGYCSNKICKEICYILDGHGTINMEKESIFLEPGDVILIEPGDVYYWEGDCRIIMVCTPAWYREQCVMLDGI